MAPRALAMAVLVAAVAWATGCMSEVQTVTPVALEAASGPLREGRVVRVPTEQGTTARLTLAQQVTVVDLVVGRFPIALGVLIRDCPPHPAPGVAGQLCAFGNVARIEVGRARRRLHAGTLTSVALGVGYLAVAGAAAVCWEDCPGPWNRVAPITLVSAPLAAVLVGLLAGVRAPD